MMCLMELTRSNNAYEAPTVSDLGRLEDLTKGGNAAGAKEGKNMKT